jgi:HK97 family phage portal protein
MGIQDFFKQFSHQMQAAARAFVLGSAVVEPFEQAFGHATETFSPTEYGDYIATSSVVYSCATLRAGMLCGLPFRPMKLVKGQKVAVERGALYELMQKVNQFWTMRRLIEMTELSLCLWGKAFWFLERGETGREVPREIWWGRPDGVRVVTDKEKYITAFLYYPLHGAEPIRFEPSEVIWFRYANPIDEFEGLSPLAAARLAADLRNSAMKSNKKLFDQGMQIGGAVFPKSGTTLTHEQAAEIENALQRRYQGVDRAHRWGVFRYEFEMKEFGINARDAEFLGTLNMSLEEVARAYKIPLDFIGGQRTYENVEAAERAIWTRCLKPEADFLADEITEQLVPMFPHEADLVEADLSKVEALHEQESSEWERAGSQIERGAITINEWREAKGMKPLPWGDVWWTQMGRVPVSSAEMPLLADGLENPATTKPTVEEDRTAARSATPVAISFGSEEHQRLWTRFVRRAERREKTLARVTADLFRRQRDSILAKLKAEAGRAEGKTIAEEPFDRAEWVKRFRKEVRPVIQEIVEEAGDEAMDDLEATAKVVTAFKVTNPAVRRFIERRAQRFAERVNETTWNQLRQSLAESIDAGEGLTAQMERVSAVMGDRIRSSSEVIARTEVAGAMHGGTLESWKQSGVVEKKVWLAALDNRTRESHQEAHGQQVGLDEDFVVGTGRGQAPGLIGVAEEDIQCRCTMTAIVKEV